MSVHKNPLLALITVLMPSDPMCVHVRLDTQEMLAIVQVN